MWLLDSRCSRYITGDKSKFVTLKSRNGGLVTFGDDTKKCIIGIVTMLLSCFHRISAEVILEVIPFTALTEFSFDI
ncbi:hypothetical protein AXF42_Ash015643 [Apostasia shenzhenica]|uniref:Retrovirus-related Pol polyprotein from transposon TNT 1-94-like beta-barrel domain-containing protein n=1 Tax=Apostasia shenzhenica TaxID=1088818 RepID=A0A2I0AKT2_9ASPA|nr:hypothetical protein AXF42_Ash015643 [Apostasia shenzhenica]